MVNRFLDYIYKLAKRCGKSFEILYIQCGKIYWQITFLDFIYNYTYIYRLAKRCGKSFEIQTNNYRQL